jgi:hypothetical protein
MSNASAINLAQALGDRSQHFLAAWGVDRDRTVDSGVTISAVCNKKVTGAVKRQSLPTAHSKGVNGLLLRARAEARERGGCHRL